MKISRTPPPPLLLTAVAVLIMVSVCFTVAIAHDSDESDVLAASTDSIFEVVDGGLTYELYPDGTAKVLRRDAIDSATIKIPSNVEYDYKKYSVTSIGTSAFNNNGLTSVTIPDSVTSIGNGAFRSNHLTSVTIPDSVTSIGNGAFYSNNLTSVTIPDSVTSIGYCAFASNDFYSVTIPDSVTSIGNGAFYSNNLTSVTIPDSITSIGEDAFSYNSLISVTIPDSITSIGNGAFSDNQLTSIAIGNNVKSIGTNAFKDNNLTVVTIPDSVTTIEENAFSQNSDVSLTLIIQESTDINGDQSGAENVMLVEDGKRVISYSKNSGSDIVTGTVPAPHDSGTSVTVAAALSRSEYAFVGWNTKTDGSGKNYNAVSSIILDSNTTLHAIWAAIYTLSYDKNSGSDSVTVPASTQHNSGTSTTISNAPSRSGYSFVEWNTNAEGTGTKHNASSSITINSDITLYAKWKAISGGTTPGGTTPGGTDPKVTIDPITGTKTEVVTNKDKTETITTTTKDGHVTVESSVEDTNTKVSSTATKTENESKVETVITTTTPAVQDNKATATVTDEQVDKAVEQAKTVMNNTDAKDAKKIVVITVPKSTDTEETEVKISADSIAKISEYGASVKIESETGTVLLDSSSVSTLSKGDLKINVGEGTLEDLNETQKKKVGNNLIVSVNAFIDSESISDIGGIATITMHYELKDGENKEDLVVYYIDGDGNTIKHKANYNLETKEVSFETTNFSHFYVAVESSLAPTEEGLPITLIIGAIAAVVIIVAAVVLLRRH